jgi:spore coat protein U-like protein
MIKVTSIDKLSSALASRSGLLLLVLSLCTWWSGAVMAQGPPPLDCMVTVNDLNFGNYDPLETTVAVITTTTMILDCNSNNTRVQIALSTGSSGTFANRTMRQGASTLNYNIFGDANFTFLWGDGTSNSFIRNVTVDKNRNETVPMYGRIPPGQDPLVGLHSDTIIVTLTF